MIICNDFVLKEQKDCARDRVRLLATRTIGGERKLQTWKKNADLWHHHILIRPLGVEGNNVRRPLLRKHGRNFSSGRAYLMTNVCMVCGVQWLVEFV